jgi:hypothetical protein
MITKHPWFGPKMGVGWGWSPVSWEGWLATGICAVIIVGGLLVYGRTPTGMYVVVGAVAALIVVCLITGTAPG